MSYRRKSLIKSIVALLLPLAGLQGMAQGKAPLRLVNGKPLTISGKLEVKFRGWRAALVIQTSHIYIADFGTEEGGKKRVSAIEVQSIGNGKLLAKHAGETVTAEGHLQMGGASPYYWNGVMLAADKVTLADGTVLQKSEYVASSIPAGVQRYLVTVSMDPRQYSWHSEAIDLAGGQPLPGFNEDLCALNGGADVLNCVCMDGFVPFRSGFVSHPLSASNFEELPVATLISPEMTQLEIPAGAVRPLTAQVACERKKAGTQ